MKRKKDLSIKSLKYIFVKLNDFCEISIVYRNSALMVLSDAFIQFENSGCSARINRTP